MTPDISAGIVPRHPRPWRLLAWLRDLTAPQVTRERREPDTWIATSDERLRRLEAELERGAES